MLPGPVFHFELLTTARRFRYYALRFAYGMILLHFIGRNNVSNGWNRLRVANGGRFTIQEMARLGLSLFITFMAIQVVAVLLLTPAMVAGVIADEKQRKTLHYLLASPLTSGEIVLGKLLARSIHLGVLVAVGLPIISLLTLFGGVDPNLVMAGFAATFTMAYFVAGLSIFVSTISRRPREAISLSYVLLLFWLFVPTLITTVMPMGGPLSLRIYEWIKPVNDWIVATSPIHALFSLGGRMGNAAAAFEFVAWMMGLQLAYGTALIALAVLLLRPTYRRADGSTRWAARLAAMKRGRSLFSRPECGDDAMLWKERYVSRTGVVAKVALILMMLTVGGLLVYLGYDSARDAFKEVATYGYEHGPYQSRNAFNVFLRFVCVILYCVLYLGTASAAAGGMTREREEDTWISLIATPLGGTEIVRAKMVGAVWGMRWVVSLLLLFWVGGLAAGSIHPIGFLGLMIETPVFVWFATALGTYLSLRSRSSSRAMTATVGLLIVVNGGYLMCCIPLGPNRSMLPCAGISPMIEGVSLATYDEVSWALGRGWNGTHADAYQVATCIIGVLGYTLGAFVLTVAAFGRFDIEADRPSRARNDPENRYRYKPPIPEVPGIDIDDPEL